LRRQDTENIDGLANFWNTGFTMPTSLNNATHTLAIPMASVHACSAVSRKSKKQSLN
jgi:hypothetical protein